MASSDSIPPTLKRRLTDMFGAGTLSALASGLFFIGVARAELTHTRESVDGLEAKVAELHDDVVSLRETVSADEGSTAEFRMQTRRTLDRILLRIDEGE